MSPKKLFGDKYFPGEIYILFISFGPGVKNFRLWAGKISYGCRNCILRVYTTSFKIESFLKEVWSTYHIRTSLYKFSKFCPLTFYGVFRTAFFVFIGTNWKNKKIFEKKNHFSFSDFERKSSGQFLKMFRRFCQNRIFCVLRNSLHLLQLFVFFVSQSDLVRDKNRLFVGKTSAGLPNWPSTFPWENCKEKRLSGRNKKFFLKVSETERKIFNFCKKNFVGPVKTGFYVSLGTFWSQKALFENCSISEISSDIEKNNFSFFS